MAVACIFTASNTKLLEAGHKAQTLQVWVQLSQASSGDDSKLLAKEGVTAPDCVLSISPTLVRLQVILDPKAVSLLIALAFVTGVGDPLEDNTRLSADPLGVNGIVLRRILDTACNNRRGSLVPRHIAPVVANYRIPATARLQL